MHDAATEIAADLLDDLPGAHRRYRASIGSNATTWQAVREGAVLINEPMANRYDVRVGDTIQVEPGFPAGAVDALEGVDRVQPRRPGQLLAEPAADHVVVHAEIDAVGLRPAGDRRQRGQRLARVLGGVPAAGVEARQLAPRQPVGAAAPADRASVAANAREATHIIAGFCGNWSFTFPVATSQTVTHWN